MLNHNNVFSLYPLNVKCYTNVTLTLITSIPFDNIN